MSIYTIIPLAVIIRDYAKLTDIYRFTNYIEKKASETGRHTHRCKADLYNMAILNNGSKSYFFKGVYLRMKRVTALICRAEILTLRFAECLTEKELNPVAVA